MARSAAVFLGRAVVVDGPYMVPAGDREYTDSDVVVRFEVLAAWKGVDTREVYVRTSGQGSACGYEFSPNGVYLVYGYLRAASGDTVWTGLCTRTRPVENAEEDRRALGPPAVDRLGGQSWASLGTPIRCPIHPAFALKRFYTWPILGLDDPEIAEWDRTWRREFPYSGLEPDRSPARSESRRRRSLTNAMICPACREAGLAWADAHGALGACNPPPDAPEPIVARAPGARAARALDDARYRALRPRGNFAFLYDDGRRLRIDTIDGKLSRLYVTLTDTTVAIALPDSALGRVYDAMVAARLWDLGPNHPPYAPMPVGATPGKCVGVTLNARSDTLVTMLEWSAARLPAHVANAGGDWAGIGHVIEAIESVVRASPEWRALLARPGD